MQIQFIGTHNTESRTSKLSSFLIDGILAVDAGSIPAELTFDQQRAIRAILLSHGHYDHICGMPAFAFANTDRVTSVYATSDTIEILNTHLLDGVIYPKLSQEESFLGKPVLDLISIEPYQKFMFEDYEIMAAPVNHSHNPVGFEILHKGKRLFYTGDTGPGLDDIWPHIRPDLIICDVTFPNRLKSVAENSDHLCPALLAGELHTFYEVKAYLPRVIATHISPQHQDEIRSELGILSTQLKADITMAHEGDEIVL